MKHPAPISPAALYLANLSEGSHGMRQPLDMIASILDSGHDANSYPWHELTYADTMVVRQSLIARYKPSTVNKMLSALRGVLKQAWRLGLTEVEAYQRAAAVENVRGSSVLSGRALEASEVRQLFEACTAEGSARGIRDAAILAVLYGCGLRRSELVKLDVEDVELHDGSILVEGKGRKQRTVYLTETGVAYIRRWFETRGDTPGPLFTPVRQGGEIPVNRLGGESITYILRRLQKESGVDRFSPHDLRRTNMTRLLEAGVDVFTVQRLAGHADASTTARYDRRGEAVKRCAVQEIEIPSAS